MKKYSKVANCRDYKDHSKELINEQQKESEIWIVQIHIAVLYFSR